MAHRYRSIARAVQRLSGSKYTAAIRECEFRIEEIKALKIARPEMAFAACAVAVCFEDRDELRSRWGDIFP